MESDEIELIQLESTFINYDDVDGREDTFIDYGDIDKLQGVDRCIGDIDCCICLGNSDFNLYINTNCCNQTLHKGCFLEWINYPVYNHNYNNKFSCVICKTKIKNFDNIISLGEFINYINKKDDKNNNDLIFHYKKIISELYKNSIITKIFNLEIQNNTTLDKEFKICFYKIFGIFFILVTIIVIMIFL